MKKIVIQKPNSNHGELAGHPIELSAESALRRQELIGKRLAVQVSPLPGEGLPDLFLRAAIRNGYLLSSTSWLLLPGRTYKSHFGHRNFVDLYIDDQTMADFLGTARGAADIEPLRYSKLSNGVVSFFGAATKTSNLAQHRRVSPRFLAESGYQKAIWSFLPIGFDPTNREYLLDRCPVCKVELTFGPTLGLCFCHACVDPNDPTKGIVDLREHPQEFVELESYENLDFACSLIDPALDAKRDATRSLHPDLRIFKRGQVFEFIALIGRLLDEADGNKGMTSVSPASLQNATAAVRNWPSGVMEVGDKTRDVWKCPTYQAGRGLRHPIFREVRAFRSLFGADFSNLVRDQLRAGISLPQSLEDGLDERTARFRRSHPRTKQTGGFDTRKEGERLLFVSLLARNSRPIRKEAKATGLPFIELTRLYEEGFALCPDENVARYLRPARTASSDLYSTILSRCDASIAGTSALYSLATCLSDGQVPWPALLQGIFEGKLAVGVEEGDQSLVRRIRVSDVEVLRGLIASSEKASWTDEAVLNNADAGFYLGVTEHEVSTLVSGGLLPSAGIKFSVLRQFRLAQVCGAETLRCLEFNRHPVTSAAVIFHQFKNAGIRAMHLRPSVRDRGAVREYFSQLDYTWK
ncbi:hypothetical protein ELH26_12075 [Rhizobium leguminosarum]|uniref:hypothetical protein n=1 Tax=Rhizobium leguminosarum TaxID=384 RepID=UPI00102FAFE4|nr:hypothetical protein [Rhizobium leguminosarum]TBC94716.1 hypothetical protein ELH26_12075 [Rhizobium leguminosarum]